MAQAHFYKIWLEGKEITQQVTGFKYEDCIEIDDILKFDITTQDLQIVDDENLVKGAELKFLYGYIGGKVSKTRVAIIENITTDYGHQIKISVEAFDKGPMMKKYPATKIWNDVTTSEIAEIIADKNGMEAVVDKTQRKHVNVIQGNMTDFEFMQKVVLYEIGYLYYLKDNKLYFIKRDNQLKAKPIKTFTRGVSDILSFKPKIEDSNKGGEGEQVTSTAVNPNTKEVQSISVNDSNMSDYTQLGGNTLNGNKFSGDEANTSSVPRETGRHIASGPIGADEQKDRADSVKREGDMSKMVGTLVVIGDPHLKAGDLITTKNFARKHSGNWQITKANHDLSGDYRTTLELKRNASNKAITKENTGAKTSNKIIGPNEADGTRQIPIKQG